MANGKFVWFCCFFFLFKCIQNKIWNPKDFSVFLCFWNTIGVCLFAQNKIARIFQMLTTRKNTEHVTQTMSANVYNILWLKDKIPIWFFWHQFIMQFIWMKQILSLFVEGHTDNTCVCMCNSNNNNNIFSNKMLFIK